MTITTPDNVYCTVTVCYQCFLICYRMSMDGYYNTRQCVLYCYSMLSMFSYLLKDVHGWLLQHQTMCIVLLQYVINVFLFVIGCPWMTITTPDNVYCTVTVCYQCFLICYRMSMDGYYNTRQCVLYCYSTVHSKCINDQTLRSDIFLPKCPTNLRVNTL
jgi:hypothetical protein